MLKILTLILTLTLTQLWWSLNTTVISFFFSHNLLGLSSVSFTLRGLSFASGCSSVNAQPSNPQCNFVVRILSLLTRVPFSRVGNKSFLGTKTLLTFVLSDRKFCTLAPCRSSTFAHEQWSLLATPMTKTNVPPKGQFFGMSTSSKINLIISKKCVVFTLA